MVPVVPGELAHKTCRFQKEQQKLQTPRGEDPATTAPKEAGSEPGAGAAASEGGGHRAGLLAKIRYCILVRLKPATRSSSTWTAGAVL